MQTDMQAAFSAGERRWESPYGTQTDLTVLVTRETGWRHSLLNNWWAGVALQSPRLWVCSGFEPQSEPECAAGAGETSSGWNVELQRSTKLFWEEKWSCFLIINEASEQYTLFFWMADSRGNWPSLFSSIWTSTATFNQVDVYAASDVYAMSAQVCSCLHRLPRALTEGRTSTLQQILLVFLIKL